MTEEKAKLHVANAAYMGSQALFGESNGTFYMPYGDYNASLGLTPEKLIVPKDYHHVTRMCYDFYQRGGIISTVINRLSEFTVTEIRNGQRNTSDEVNAYYKAVLHNPPSRLMRFLRQMALEYYLTGMVLPKIDWEEKFGEDISPDLKKGKLYFMPKFDLYPPLLVDVRWAGWGSKTFWLKIPDKDIRLIKNGGSRIKEQQLKYRQWVDNYPSFVDMVVKGADSIKLEDVDPIMRKEISISPYPTPYLFPVLEPLIFKQQLRRMDYAVASRVINAILLVKEGNDDFPLTDDNSDNLDKLKEQIQARAGNPMLMERLFMLFTNHTTQLEWVTPDLGALLNQEKYRQVNEELEDGLGFTGILLTGESRQAQASEVSTWAIQPQMEEFRAMALEWIIELYKQAKDRNSFSKVPAPKFTPIKLQDFVKTAAVFQALFSEGNVSRTTRDEMAGIDLETETELMKDEQAMLKGLPAFVPTPYSPAPPIMGQGGGQGPGRPIGSQNVPINNRNSGVKPKGQKPLSKIKASETATVDWNANNISMMDDEEVLALMDRVAKERGIVLTPNDIIDKD